MTKQEIQDWRTAIHVLREFYGGKRKGRKAFKDQSRWCPFCHVVRKHHSGWGCRYCLWRLVFNEGCSRNINGKYAGENKNLIGDYEDTYPYRFARFEEYLDVEEGKL